MIRIYIHNRSYFLQDCDSFSGYGTKFLYNNYVGREYDTDYGSIRFYSLNGVDISIRIFIPRGSDMFRSTHNFIISSTSKFNA